MTDEILIKLKIFKDVKGETLRYLAEYAEVKGVAKGKDIFFDHEPVPDIYILISGVVSLYKLNYLGEKKVILLYQDEHLLNETVFEELPSSINCSTLENSQLLIIPKKIFLKALEMDFGLSKNVMHSVSHKVRRLYRQLKNTSGSIRGDKKLAAKLWRLAQEHGVQNGDGICIRFNLSVTYLAEMLGSQRETVSRQIKMLKDAGLIKKIKDKIIVSDLDGLAEYFKKD